MSETSEKSKNQLSLFASTTSQDSEGGSTRSDSPDGPPTAKSGLAACLASLGRSQAKDRRLTTREIYGPLFFISSPSASLQWSLANKLREHLPTAGSTEFAMTWRESVTPAGRPYCLLQVSVRRISEHDSTGAPSGWTTPDGSAINEGETLETFQARRTMLKTKGYNGNGAGMPIAVQAQLAAWPSPKAQNANQSGPSRVGCRADLQTVAGWATPTERDHKDGASDLSNVEINCLLGRQARLAVWPTPMTPKPHDSENTVGQDCGQHQANIGRQVGALTAPTEDREGCRLNPAFSLWLMAGDSVTPELIRTCPRGLLPSKGRGTRSASRSRRNSSAS